MKRFLVGVSIIFLMFSYLILAYLVLNPNVSSAYYDYYIAKSSDLSPKELERIKNSLPYLIPNEVYDHKSKDLGFSGWSHSESEYRWSNSKKAKIIFTLDDYQKFKGFIKLNIRTLSRQQVSIFLNGADIYSEIIEGVDVELDVHFDRLLLLNGNNELEFKLPDARRPGNGDPRILAIGLISFSIH